MKKFIAILSSVILLFGLLFKSFHWPGCDIMIITSIGLLFPIVYLLDSISNIKNGSNKLEIIVLFLFGTMLQYGVLFELFHWPWSSNILGFSILFFLLYLVSKVITSKSKIKVGLASFFAFFVYTGLVFRIGYFPGVQVMTIFGIFGLIGLFCLVLIHLFNGNSLQISSKHLRLIIPLFFTFSLGFLTSTPKNMLYSFVAIEENIYNSSVSECSRAKSDIANINRALAEAQMEARRNKDGGESDVAEKQSYIDMVAQIDMQAGELIKMIDEAKIHLLDIAGEDVLTVSNGDNAAIVWVTYDKSNPCLPAKLNLDAISGKDNFDIPMHELIGPDITSIDESALGIPIWNKYKDFRLGLLETIGNYTNSSGDIFTLKAEPIDDFENNTDLLSKVESMLKGSGNNIRMGELMAFVNIYTSLTKKEIAEHHGPEGIHWLGRTFDHSPMMAALTSLSIMQNEVLRARAQAISVVANRCGAPKYAFDS